MNEARCEYRPDPETWQCGDKTGSWVRMADWRRYVFLCPKHRSSITAATPPGEAEGSEG